MSEYTPTTEEVLRDYRFSNQRPDICGKDFSPEFYRWLNSVKAEAWDEGFDEAIHGFDLPDWGGPGFESDPNPYRTGGAE